MDSDDNAEIEGPRSGRRYDAQARPQSKPPSGSTPRMRTFARASWLCPGWHRTGFRWRSLLTQVATYAVQAIPGADGAGLTLLEQDRADTIVATAPFVTEIDDIQYAMDQGPCISAAREGQTVLSGSLGGDPRWPRFGGRVARLGVHSVVVVAVDHA